MFSFEFTAIVVREDGSRAMIFGDIYGVNEYEAEIDIREELGSIYDSVESVELGDTAEIGTITISSEVDI